MTFRPIAEADSIHVEDIDGNVSWDLIVGGSEGRDRFLANGGRWCLDGRANEVSDHDASGLVVADFDNDSWLDLLVAVGDQAAVESDGALGFCPLERHRSDSRYVPDLCLAILIETALSIWLASMEDVTGRADLNRTSNLGHYVDVRFKGIDDNASGRVNHYAIGSVLELRFRSALPGQNRSSSPSTHFGLDGYDSASSVRAILPNGLTQTIRDPKIDSLVEEEQTLKGSCPYLYAWDGEKFVFKTDCLWAAPLGLQVAHGVVAKDRPWEYLKIDGADIRPAGDLYEFRITEELWEVAYFDKVAMSVVDHPADVEVWTNEKVGPGEIATPTIFAFASDDLRPVKAASDSRGRDVTERLARADRNFVQAFDQRLRQGLCPPHWIDLDFGELSGQEDASENAKIYLVLTGWILPTDTSLNIQIDQNPELGPIEFPSVWVPDASAARWLAESDSLHGISGRQDQNDRGGCDRSDQPRGSPFSSAYFGTDLLGSCADRRPISTRGVPRAAPFACGSGGRRAWILEPNSRRRDPSRDV